jgi:hypothetical protein
LQRKNPILSLSRSFVIGDLMALKQYVVVAGTTVMEPQPVHRVSIVAYFVEWKIVNLAKHARTIIILTPSLALVKLLEVESHRRRNKIGLQPIRNLES